MSHPSGEMFVERCNLYTEHGFSTIAIAANNRIGKLCLLRKSDYPRSLPKKDGENDNVDGASGSLGPAAKDVANAYFVIEFYNSVEPHCTFLEKAVPVWDPPLESIAWLGNKVFAAGSDGSVLALSPFSHTISRFQISPTSIIAAAAVAGIKLAFLTESGDVLIAHYVDPNAMLSAADDELASSNELTTTKNDAHLRVVQRLKLAADAQPICLASSKRDANMLAVGLVNGLTIFNLSAPNQPYVIKLTKDQRKDQTIMAMIFVDDFLFTGDSCGVISIYNANTGAFLKKIDAHKFAILAMATDGVSVFSAGVDQRIQIISGIQSDKRRYDWAMMGQRLMHENDVNALACTGAGWLVSGGTEHHVFVSNISGNQALLIQKPSCFFARGPDADSTLILMKYPHFLELWYRPSFADFLKEKITATSLDNGSTDAENNNERASSTVIDIGAEQAAKGPKKIARIDTGENDFNLHATISPNGNFFSFSNDFRLKVFQLNVGSILGDNLTDASNTTTKKKRSKSGSESAPLLKYWDSAESKEFDSRCGDDTTNIDQQNGNGRISAMLMTNDAIYFAEADFALWRLSLSSASRAEPESLVEKKGAGQIVKLVCNSEENTFIAITTNSQVLRITTEPETTNDDNADNENGNNENNDDIIRALKFDYSPLDCVFVAPKVVLFACAQRIDASLVFVDVANGAILKTVPKRSVFVGHNQVITALSDVQDDRLFFVTNKGKVRALSNLAKVQPFVFVKEKGFDKKEMESTDEFCQYEPHWGFSFSSNSMVDDLNTSEGRNKSPSRRKTRNAIAKTKTASDVNIECDEELRRPPKRTLLLVGHVSLAPPSQAPVRVRGFETN